MLEDRQGNLWIGSPGVGLLRFDRQKRSFVRYRHDPADPNSLAEENVMTLFRGSRREHLDWPARARSESLLNGVRLHSKHFVVGSGPPKVCQSIS